MIDQPLPVNTNANPSLPNVPQPGVQSAIPPTSPLDIGSILQQASSTPAYQGATGKLEDIAGRERGVEQAGANMPIPKMGPQIDRSAGILHNLGQALLMLANTTAVGRDVNRSIYGPGIAKYQAGKQANAAQLAALKDEEAIPTEELHGLTQLAMAGGNAAYRAGSLDVQNRKVDVSQQNADTRAQQVTNQHMASLERISQGWDRLDLGQRQLKAKEWFDQGVLGAMHERVAAGQDENSARIQAQEDMKSATAQNTTSVGRMVSNWLGLTPEIQSAPGAQATKPARTGATQAAPAKTGGGVQYATDPQGKLHSAPAGAKLPAGWKAAKGPK